MSKVPRELVHSGPLRLLIHVWQLEGGRIDDLDESTARACRRVISGESKQVSFGVVDRIAMKLDMPEYMNDLYPPVQPDRGGFDVSCPECHTGFVAVRPERPFRHATPSSVVGPPTVRPEPKRVDERRICRCEHCGNDFHPARGSKNPRFCSKSCARRNVLARKHGFLESALEAA